MPQSTGLVLSGGGLKGAYQAGAWKALCEHRIDKQISVISGCSIGVLNALLFLSVPPEKIIDVWLGLKKDDVLQDNKHLENFKKLGKPGIDLMNILAVLGIQAVNLFLFGAFSRAKHLEILEEIVNWDILKNKRVKVFASCSRIISPIKLEPEYFELNLSDKENTIKTVMASSAIPVVFPVQLFNGSFYYDGGLTDNVPVSPLDNEACSDIIVIHLSGRNKIKTGDNIKNPVAHIFPSRPLGQALEFNKNNIKSNIELGYRDMKMRLTNGKYLLE